MIKKYFLLTIVLFSALVTEAADVVKSNNHEYSIEDVQGGVMEYAGTIGSLGVEFNYVNLHMGNGPQFLYRYTTVTVNKGDWIELQYAGNKNGYQVWNEYINGRNTGTFTIQWTPQYIKGTFVNSKNKTFNVSAKRLVDNWVDSGDSPFVTNAQGAMQGFFSHSNNQAYRWLCTIAHPTNVFTSGSCTESGDYVTVTVNSKNFVSSNKYTLQVRLHKNGQFFDSIQKLDDTDWLQPFVATNVGKNLIVNFWRNYSTGIISKIEKTFGLLTKIKSEHMCLAVLSALYMTYQSNPSGSGNNGSYISFNISGRIGDNYESPCSMSYNQQTDTGRFVYGVTSGNIKRTLKMVSFDTNTNVLILKEYTTKGDVVGCFAGRYQNGSYEGYFTNMNNGASIPFSMN